MTRPLILFLTVAALAFGALLAQQPAAKERVAVTLIEVPVHVVDRSGAPVRGLTRENFEITDDGRKREITHFEVIDLQKLPAETDAPINPAARRSFLLLFDLSNSSPTALLRSREAARDFVLKQLGPHDLAAVATYSIEQSFRVVTSFTFDREMLSRAIESLGQPKFFRAGDPLLIAALTAEGDEGRTVGGGDLDIAAEIRGPADIARRNDEDYRRGRIRQQVNSFATLARVLDSIRGRKQVILLSEGFDARLIHGRENLSSAEAARETDAVISGEIWNVDSDARFGSASGTTLVSAMGEIFKRSDVTLHTLDIQGLRGSADLEGGLRDPGASERFGSGGGRRSNEALFLLANETGGQFFKNANDLRENFGDLLRSQEVIYILGFQTSAGGSPGKFHNLRVRLRDGPGGARAYHRAGYFQPGGAESPLQRSFELVEILMNDIPFDEVDIDLLAVPFLATGGAAQVPVVLEVSGSDLLLGASGNAVTAELFVYAFDRDRKVRDFVHQRISLDPQKTAQTLRRSGVKYYGVLMLPPGQYAVKAVVRTTGSELTGFARAAVTVPEFTRSVVLPPLFLEEGEEWVMVKSPPRRAAEVDYPFVIGADTFIPAVAPRLRRDKTYDLALVTYNVPTEGLQIGATLAGGGTTMPAPISLAGRTAPDPVRGTRYLLKLNPAQVAPGQYTLTVALTPSDGSGTNEASARFVVE